MTAKLTLSVEKRVVRRAKHYAERNGKSLSKIVEQYLESLAETDSKNKTGVPPKLKRLYGTVKLPKDLDHKKEIRKILSAKG
jgi:hypothetical protein